jgi:hypothetical protein
MSDDAEKKENLGLPAGCRGAIGLRSDRGAVLRATCALRSAKTSSEDEKVSSEEVEAALRSATIANFVGCCAVEQAICLGYVERENVLCIDGILCAQMVRM